MANNHPEFDVYIRKKDDVFFRFLLIPRVKSSDDSKSGANEVYWSYLGKHSLPIDSPKEELMLWLPPQGMELKLNLSDKSFKCSMVGFSPQDDGLEIKLRKTDPIQDLTISCFGGVQFKGDDQVLSELRDAVRDIRNSKLSCLLLAEAFRYPGDLDEFARAGEEQALIAASNLIFEAKFADGITVKDITEKVTLTFGKNFFGNDEVGAEIFATCSFDKPTGEKIFNPTLHLPPPQEVIELLEIEAVQKTEGIFFKLPGIDRELARIANQPADKPEHFELFKQPLDELRLFLARSVGDVPLEDSPLVATSYISDVKFSPDTDEKLVIPQGFKIGDSLQADEFAGQQLHYRLSVVDAFGDERACASYSLVRTRLDTPPVPVELSATVCFCKENDKFQQQTIRYKAEFPGLETQIPRPLSGKLDEQLKELFEVEIFYLERPLDECGFYGDDDDFGLLEGLQQADANFAPVQSDATDEERLSDHPQQKRLRGAFDRDGMEKLPISQEDVQWRFEIEGDDNDEAENPVKVVTLEYEARIDKLLTEKLGGLSENKGYHFYVGLRRKIDKRNIGVQASCAPLALCKHLLHFGDPKNDTDSWRQVRVYQIEFFSLYNKTNSFIRLLNSNHMSLELLQEKPSLRADQLNKENQKAPLGVNLTFRLLPPNEEISTGEHKTIPVGGIRLLVRDRVTDLKPDEDDSPFRVVDTIQALPSLVNRYRPIRIESGMDLQYIPGPSDLAMPGFMTFDKDKFAKFHESTNYKAESDAEKIIGPGGVVEYARLQLDGFIKLLSIDSNKELFRDRGASASFNPESKGASASLFASQLENWRRLKNEEKELSDEIKKLEALKEKSEQEKLELKELQLEKSELEEKIKEDFPKTYEGWRERFNRSIKSLKVSIDSVDFSKVENWQVIRIVLTAMRELGLVRDLVAPLSQLPTVIHNINERLKPLKKTDYPGIRVFVVQNIDDETMATIRIAVTGWNNIEKVKLSKLSKEETIKGLVESLGLTDHFKKFIAELPRVLIYKEKSQEPTIRSIRQNREVQYAFTGIQDRWHHELDFAIQLQGRYQRLTDLIRNREQDSLSDKNSDTALVETANLPTEANALQQMIALDKPYIQGEDKAGGIKSITIPRLEEAPDHPGIYPAPNRPDYLVAVEVLDLNQRHLGTHNLVSRTRYGHIEEFIKYPKASFQLAEVYTKHDKEKKIPQNLLSIVSELCTNTVGGVSSHMSLYAYWTKKLADASSFFTAHAEMSFPGQLFACRNDSTSTELEWAATLVDVKQPDLDHSRGSPEPKDWADTKSYWHLPYYYDYRIEGFYSADYQTGKSASCSLNREPWGLGLPVRPVYCVESKEGEYWLKIQLIPALLGSHVFRDELPSVSLQPKSQTTSPTSITLNNDPNGNKRTFENLGPTALSFSQQGPWGPGTNNHIGTDEWDIPVFLLPDVCMQYYFFTQRPTRGGKSLYTPFCSWEYQRENGFYKARPAANEKPYGFSVKELDSNLFEPGSFTSKSVVNSEGPQIFIEISAKFLKPEYAETFRDNEENAGVHFMLQRNTLRTNLTYAMRRQE